jgi:hypothetical protein
MTGLMLLLIQINISEPRNITEFSDRKTRELQTGTKSDAKITPSMLRTSSGSSDLDLFGV